MLHNGSTEFTARPREPGTAPPDATPLPASDREAPDELLIQALRDFIARSAWPAWQPERSLFQLEKLATLGQLSSEFAHDFNNLLTVVLGYGQMLQNHCQNNRLALGYADEMLRSAERAAHLASLFLGLNRKSLDCVTMLDLGKLVRGLSDLLARVVGKRGHFHLEIAPEPACIRANVTRIEQLVINLVRNARDALGDQGAVQVTVRHETLPQPRDALFGALHPGRYVRLDVCDDGCGIEPAQIPTLFHPFFTTKEHGTGLGLTIVARVVRACQAALVIDSEPNRGTIVSIYFPAVADAGSVSADHQPLSA